VKVLVAACLLLTNTALADAPLPPDDAYVQIKNGHLTLNGQRVRYWAAIGSVFSAPQIKPDDTPEQRGEKVRIARRGTDVIIDHLIYRGFNAVRLWSTAPNQENYTFGDGSGADAVDYFIARMKQKGLRIWTAGLNDAGEATPADDAIISDAATATAWRAAIAGWDDGKVNLRNNLARIWDPRLQAIGIRNIKAVATHFNKHTKLRWCDDPVFVVWELSNEEWWHRRMVGGQWQKLPPFFKNQLVAQWNRWLQKKYGRDKNLRRAWQNLLPGESLQQGTVLFAPMAGATSAAVSMNDANPAARQALEGLKQQYSREDFAPQRASDVIAFLLDIQLAHKRREAAAVKSWGRGTRLSPLIHDTGIGYEIQSQYLHQQAGAVAHDAYVNGWGPRTTQSDLAQAKSERERMYLQLDRERISANAGPWVNWLLKPPGISQGVPWLEHNRVEGMPFLCYETQIQQPAKYRADFPLRVAALASIQDWDFVCWHYFAPGGDVGTAARPFDRALDVTTGGHPQGYHFTFDEVQNAMMRAAAHLFRQHQLQPAPNPTRFIYGRKALYDPESMDYAGSYGTTGMDMLQTTYQYGVRIRIDPRRKNDRVSGPVVKFDDRLQHNPYTPTQQIVFDWKKGYLAMDAPAAVAWTGLLANYGNEVRFKNGVTLRDVRINNPAGIYDPVRDDEKYIAFALHSLDGQPLASTRRASLSLVSTSFNTGFKMNVTGDGKLTATRGELPVLVARVGAVLEASALNGMRYTFRDWHMQAIGSGVVTNGTLVIAANQPVFVVELTR